MPVRILTALATVCLLAACGGAQHAATTPAAVTLPQVSPPPAPASAPLPAQSTVRTDVHTAPAPVRAPDTLIGLAPDALDKLLGKPDLIRQDGPAEVRLYSAPENSCTFHVFLYPDGKSSRSQAVEHVEARNASGRLEGAAMKTCYRALVAPAIVS